MQGREIVRSHFESTLWDTAISEANLRANSRKKPGMQWATARRSIYHMVMLREPMIEDCVRCLVLAFRSSTKSPAWIMARRFEDPTLVACLLDDATEERIAEACHAVVKLARAIAMGSLNDQAVTRLGAWQGPDLCWWISDGDGLFSRVESKMTAYVKEIREHYFHVEP